MQTNSFHRFLLYRLAEKPRTEYELRMACRRPTRTGVPGHLSDLVLAGLADYDFDNFTYNISEEALMRIRKKPPIVAGPVVDLAKERDRLVESFHGPGGNAIAAVEGDEILSERLQIALHDGMEVPDLSEVPKHRRPAVVEDALLSWAHLTKSGPCDFCGTRVARRPPVSLGYLEPREIPGFSTKHDSRKACGWCDDLLSSRTRDEFREMIGNAVAATIGITMSGDYRYSHLVQFAHEVGYVGTPFGYFDDTTEEGHARTWAIRARAFQVVHKSRFVQENGINNAGFLPIPGIEKFVWPKELLPGQERKQFVVLADVRRDFEERQELARRRAEAKKSKPGHIRRNASLDAFAAERARQEQELQDWARKNGVI